MADGGLLDEIFVALGFKVDDKKVKDFDNSLKTTIGSLKRLVTIASGAVIAVDRMTNALLKANQAYINFNQQTGISIANMNSLIGAGMLANYNLTPESMMSSVQALQSNLAAIRIGQGNIAPFQMLGISPVGKDAVQVIEELRGALQGVDDAMATNIIQQMGLSPDMLSLLRLTNEQFREFSMQANRFQLQPKQREALDEFAKQMRIIHMEIGNLKDRALISIAPYLIKFLDRFTQILEVAFQYRKFLVFLGTGGVIAVMQMDKAIKILGLTINKTFGKWLLALTAIYLILEDLAVWKMGGQSLIGDLYEWSKQGFRDPGAIETNKKYDELSNLSNRIKDKNNATTAFIKFMQSKPMQFFANKIDPSFNEKFYRNARGELMRGVGNVEANQRLEQNNYITVADKEGYTWASKTADLAFAFMNMDWSK